MALDSLRQNIEREKEIARELTIFVRQRDVKEGRDREILDRTISSLIQLMRMINNSIPDLLESVTPVKKLGEAKDIKGMVKMSYPSEKGVRGVTIIEKDRRKFLEMMEISRASMKRMRKEEHEKEMIFRDFRKPSAYAKISNRLFESLSNKLVEGGHFEGLGNDLRKANLPFLLKTYISIILFSTMLASIFAVVFFVFLLFFSFSAEIPFFIAAEGFAFERILINLGICAAIPLATFGLLYVYPMSEKESVKRKIEQELPFATMHMSAIAGSGIEPSQIFKIIALGNEYQYTKQEIKKILNQINVYGYDLVNALKNSASTTSSPKMAELFNGLATTISSGGSLTDFLDKRTETLLFDYRLEKERSTKLAETFMDIYISVVIAAPMIMMLLLVLISVSHISIGLGILEITLLIISIISLINILFLVILKVKQPGY